MIGKAKSNHSLSATINYNIKHGSGIFYTNKLEGDELKEYRYQFADLQRCYSGTGKSLTIHAQLSPSIEDGKKLSMDDWKKMAKLFLEKMDLDENQAIAFIHTDKEHPHAHFIINRVNENDFGLYNDSFIGKKTSRITDEIAQSMGLERARQIGEQNKEREKLANQIGALPTPEKLVGSKQIFKAFLEEISNQDHPDISSYFKAIESAGYNLRLYKNKDTGELRGYRISKNGTFMDASAIDKKFTIKNLNFSADKKVANEKRIRKTEFVQLGKIEKKRTGVGR